MQLLKDAGYEIKEGKQLAFRCKNQKRFIRLDTLGDGYSKDELLGVLSGEKEHKPRRRKSIAAEKPKVNLLIDLQTRLQGKGAGYARWAKVYNLKQMAQAMNYLTDHNLLEYDALRKKTEEVTTRHNTLSAQIKSAEARMAEIAVLRTHIINYSKTREVYVEYRKSGYSKKFLAEHESDIILHKAAKKTFDELGLTKIPTKKSLDAEYARLLEEKKQAFGEFRKVRDEMRELLTVKSNVDRMLGVEEEQKREEKKKQEQR